MGGRGAEACVSERPIEKGTFKQGPQSYRTLKIGGGLASRPEGKVSAKALM